MHVVVISDYLSQFGGQAKVALDGAVGVARLGHHVHAFGATGPVWEGLAEAGVATTFLDEPDLLGYGGSTKGMIKGLWNARAARTLRAVLDGCDPADTIVHVHGWAKALSPSIGPVLARSGLPVVYTLHEYFLACPAGAFYDYGDKSVCRRRPMSLSCISANCDSRSYVHKIWRVARQAVLHTAGRMPSQFRDFIYLSDLQRDVLAPYLPRQARWHRVMNPISMPRLDRKTVPGETFLFVGRLSFEKGAPLFAEAAKRLGVKAVFVGDGPYRATLEKDFPEAEVLGWKGPDEVARIMRQARVLVFPSIWYEGQPLTIYESLSLGTPVIVSDICAGREAVADGINGCHFPTQDVDALSARLAEFQDAETALAYSHRAYDTYWADALTPARHCERLIEVYEEVIAAFKGKMGEAA